MEVLYCNKWSLHRKRPLEVLDSDVAYKRHCDGQRYTAVLSENGIVNYVIEVDEGGVIVRFMNNDTQTYLLYGFRRKNEDDIFMNTVYYYEYQDGKQTEHMIFNFKENGELYMEKRNMITGDVDARESIVDVTCNWEKFPHFGDYSKLIVLERELNI